MDASGDPRKGFGESGSTEAVEARPADVGPRRASRGSGGVALARPARSLVRFLYTSNPFYILSADLVFVGLRMSFGAGGPAAQSWALAMSLAGYTLLLATTACVLIRVGRLWDDLRSLLVLVVMMFLAIAMSCDDTMADNPSKGALGYLGGFLFAVVVTEGVLHTIRLRLPGWYRLSYYVILALVFLYPVALTPLLGDPENPTLQWALFGFSPMAGLAVATLVPAARRGRLYLEKNGSPWRWPLYPWTLFFLLVGGLSVRCSSLCVSFHYVEGSRTIFGPYFLVPIGLAVSLVWLEIGISFGSPAHHDHGLGPPAGPGVSGDDRTSWRPGLPHVPGQIHPDPRRLAGLPGTLGSHAVPGVWRSPDACPGPGTCWRSALAGLAVVGPRTIDLAWLVAPRALPMGGAGLVLAVAAWRNRDSRRAAVAAGCLVSAITRGAGELWPIAELWPIGLHLGIGSLLVLGAFFDDGLGRLARRSGALALLLLGLDAATGHPRIWPTMSPGLIAVYPLLIAVSAWSYSFLVRDRLYLGSGVISLAGWMAHSGWGAYDHLRKIVVGLDQIVWGMIFFLVAMAISMRKAGIWPGAVPKWIAWLLGRWWQPGWESAPPSPAAPQETAEA